MTRKVIERFAEKAGLVYFGTVDHGDDHRLVRGHTVSATQIDTHYCIGTVHGYDVILLQRNDVLVAHGDKKEARHHWLIVTIDLHSPVDVPHTYIGHHAREHAYNQSHTRLLPLRLGVTTSYPAQFTGNYTVYGEPARSIEIEQLLTADMATVISTHFQGASVEIEANTVYMYIESAHPSEPVLEKLLSNGLWLAEQIDTRLLAKHTAANQTL